MSKVEYCEKAAGHTSKNASICSVGVIKQKPFVGKARVSL